MDAVARDELSVRSRARGSIGTSVIVSAAVRCAIAIDPVEAAAWRPLRRSSTVSFTISRLVVIVRMPTAPNAGQFERIRVRMARCRSLGQATCSPDPPGSDPAITVAAADLVGPGHPPNSARSASRRSLAASIFLEVAVEFSQTNSSVGDGDGTVAMLGRFCAERLSATRLGSAFGRPRWSFAHPVGLAIAGAVTAGCDSFCRPIISVGRLLGLESDVHQPRVDLSHRAPSVSPGWSFSIALGR